LLNDQIPAPISAHGFPAIMDPAELAARLKMSPKTLAEYRQSGEGPQYISVSRRCVRYTAAAVEDWLANRRRASTSAAVAA